MSVAERVTTAEYSTLEVELRGAALVIRVHRPEAHGAISPQMLTELRDAFALLREGIGVSGPAGELDWSVRGVILTGTGSKSFVAGADIAAMRSMTEEEARAFSAEAQELTLWIEELPIPVVAAVNGYALGGGCELAMACDIIYASENAVFGQPEVGLGLVPGFGGCVRFQQYVGIATASELILTGRRIDSEEALAMELVSQVFPDRGSLMAGAEEAIRIVTAQSPLAVSAAKRTLRSVQSLSTREGLEIERDAFAACFGTDDAREGMTAFVEKRPPEFPGR